MLTFLHHHFIVTVLNSKMFQPLKDQQQYDSSRHITNYTLHIKLNSYKWWLILLTHAAQNMSVILNEDDPLKVEDVGDTYSVNRVVI